MGFRENLKDELEYQGMKVKDLAEKTQISKRTLDQYLTTTAKIPNVINAVKIAQALNVSVEYLVTGNCSNQNTKNYRETEEIIKTLSLLNTAQKSALLDFIKASI